MATREDRKLTTIWKSALKKRGVKQVWLANKVGCSPAHISNILANRVLITDKNKNKIAKILNSKINE